MNRFLLFLFALFLGAAQADAFVLHGGGALPSPPTCTITAANLSATSFAAGASVGTSVGTASVSTTGTCGSVSWSVSGTNASDFTFSGSMLEINAANLCAASYSIEIVATISGATNSPYTVPPGSGFSGTITTTGSCSEITVALTRTINNPSGTTLGSTAFWSFGQPFKPDEVPSGYYISSATVGDTTVPGVACVDRIYAYDGSLEWCRVLLNMSGMPTSGTGNTGSIVLTATPGTDPSTTSRTNADWEALNDQISVTNLVGEAKTSSSTASGDVLNFSNGSGNYAPQYLTTCMDVSDLTTPSAISSGTTVSSFNSSTVTLSEDVASTIGSGDTILFTSSGGGCSADVVGSESWVAKFDGGPTNTITVNATSPLGIEVKVVAALVDANPLTVSSSSYLSGTETINTSSAHGLATGNQVLLNTSVSCSAAVTVTSTTQFTCPVASNPGSVSSEAPFNRNLFAVCYYTVYELPSTAEGPISSECNVQDTLIHMTVSAINTIAPYNYNVTYSRGGSAVRSWTGLTIPAFAIANLERPDGQDDWNEDDPGIWISQSCPTVVATKKVPPFNCAGVTYIGSSEAVNNAYGPFLSNPVTITADSASLGISYPGNLFGDGNYPVAVEITATSCPSGFTCGSTIYWAVEKSGSTTILYDTLADALLAGSTGEQTPTSTGSTVALIPASAPGTTGAFTTSVSATGNRFDISMTGEWFAGGYLTGETQAWEQLGRLQAYDLASEPFYTIENSTGDVPYLSSDVSPNWTTLSWTIGPNGGGLNGNVNANGGPNIGGWILGGSANQHWYNTIFGVWLLEGEPALRDLLIGQANGVIGTNSASSRNYTIGATTYSGQGVCTALGAGIREGAWFERSLIYGWFAAGASAAEAAATTRAYFADVETDNMAMCAAYESGKGSNYQAIGIMQNDGPSVTGSTLNSPETSIFMEDYWATAIGFAQTLAGDYFSGISTQVNFVSNFEVYVTDGAGSGFCTYYGYPYTSATSWNNYGGASPGTYPSSPADFGIGGTAIGTASFSSSSTTVTFSAVPWTMQDGDLVRFTNYDTTGSGATPGPTPPSNIYPTQDYYIVSPSGDTAELATTKDGTPITPASTVSGVNMVWIWQSQDGCPTTTPQAAQPDSYTTYKMSAMATLANAGASGASTGFSNIQTRYNNNSGGVGGAYEMQWWMAPY